MQYNMRWQSQCFTIGSPLAGPWVNLGSPLGPFWFNLESPLFQPWINLGSPWVNQGGTAGFIEFTVTGLMRRCHIYIYTNINIHTYMYISFSLAALSRTHPIGIYKDIYIYVYMHEGEFLLLIKTYHRSTMTISPSAKMQNTCQT